MERIALTKIKFDSPTLNQTDRNNLNLEFSELTEELISLRDKKFNGVSLFTPLQHQVLIFLEVQEQALKQVAAQTTGLGFHNM